MKQLLEIYVVTKNDYPVAAFRSQAAAAEFKLGCPKKDDSGHFIYWNIHKLKLER